MRSDALNESTAHEALLAARSRLLAADDPEPKEPEREPYYSPDNHLEETIEGALGLGTTGLVTRNHYGCLVLNAHRTLFIDVDIFVSSEVYDPIQGREDRMQPVRQQILDDLRTVLHSERNYGFRIYRTAGGFRVLATTQQFQPGTEEAERLMHSVGADRHFVNLCRVQQNFRARLTPKPWRCGMNRPPSSFPRASADDQRRFNEWLSQYDRVCRDRSTCQFLEHVGPRSVDELVAPVITVHDRETKALEMLPLA